MDKEQLPINIEQEEQPENLYAEPLIVQVICSRCNYNKIQLVGLINNSSLLLVCLNCGTSAYMGIEPLLTKYSPSKKEMMGVG